MQKAYKIINESTEEFVIWYKSLSVVPMISQLNQKCLELIRNEVRQYANNFDPQDSEKTELLVRSLVKKVLHNPIKLLKSNQDMDCINEWLTTTDWLHKALTDRLEKSVR